MASRPVSRTLEHTAGSYAKILQKLVGDPLYTIHLLYPVMFHVHASSLNPKPSDAVIDVS